MEPKERTVFNESMDERKFSLPKSLACLGNFYMCTLIRGKQKSRADSLALK